MEPLAVIAAVGDTGSTAALLALLLIVVLRRDKPPPTAVSLDSSVERWITRLEGANDAAERRELAREYNDAEHRAWDTGILLAVALGVDAADIRARVAQLGPPPRLSPDPVQWLDVEARRHARRLDAAPLAPETPDPAT